MAAVAFIFDFVSLIAIKLLTIVLQIVSFPFELLSLVYRHFVFKKKTFHSIVVTGASSGIGFHFALEMSKQTPPPRLVLIARRLNKLKIAQQQCMRNGCDNVEIYSCDVTDKLALKEILEACDDKMPIDFVFANAGYRADLHDAMVPSAYNTFDINVMGVLNTILPLTPRMVARKQGQIVINASVAGLTPQKLFPFYGAAKFGLLGLADNLRSNLTQYNVGVTVTLPGFVETDLVSHLSDGKLPMIGTIKVGEAVKQIRFAAEYDLATHGFPFIATILAYLYGSLSSVFKRSVLDCNVIERLIGWYDVVPDRKWISESLE